MKILLSIILGIALAITGEILAFYVYSNYSQGGFINGLLGISAVIAILLGIVLALSYPIKYAEQLEVRLKEKSKLIKFLTGSIIFIVFITPFVVAVAAFYHFTETYHEEQLEKYGVVTTVIIQSEINDKNNRHDLCFQFMHDGITWEGMLDRWNYTVGDTVEIIYSSQNPNEHEWYKKYTADKATEP